MNYIWNSCILVFTVTGLSFISYFASLVGISIRITVSAKGLKMFSITAGIKKYKLVIKKKEKKLNKIVLLAKTKLNSIEFLISKDLTDSSISY